MTDMKTQTEQPISADKRLIAQEDLLAGGTLSNRSAGVDPAEWRNLAQSARENPAFDVEMLNKQLPLADLMRLEEQFGRFLINQIGSRMELEAQVGRGHAIAMSLVSWDYSPPAGIAVFGLLKPEWLRGAAKMVYDYCKRGPEGQGPDLRPTLEYWDDGIGTAGGFNIVVHFAPSADASKDQNLADLVISQIPARARLEAAQGRGHAILMSIPTGDIDISNKNYRRDVVTPDMLRGSAKTVFDYCQGGADGKGADLKPTIEYWDDGKGEHNGFNIVIHW